MTTPSGIWNVGELRLATMLSVVEPFQTFVGAADSAEALTRIHYEGLTEPADTEKGIYTKAELLALRPCAVITAPMEENWEATRIAEQRYMAHGKLVAVFLKSAAETNQGEPTADEYVVYKNLVGPIISKATDADADGLLDLARQSPYLSTMKISCEAGPYPGNSNDITRLGIWIGSRWLIEW